MCSGREPKRTLSVAEFIVNKLSKQNGKYDEIKINHKLAEMDAFVKRLASNEISGVSLLSIKTKNVTLANSPTIELESKESVIPAVNELKAKDVNLIRPSNDIMSLRISFEGKQFNLKLQTVGDEVMIIPDNKNASDEVKEKLSELLDAQFGH
jgi:hypothetical protein